jgi:hypothetical protein
MTKPAEGSAPGHGPRWSSSRPVPEEIQDDESAAIDVSRGTGTMRDRHTTVASPIPGTIAEEMKPSETPSKVQPKDGPLPDPKRRRGSER